MAAASLLAAACTFPDPEIRDSDGPTIDAQVDHTGDRGPSDAGAEDAPPHHPEGGRGCPPPPTCYAQAGSCSEGCKMTESSCANQVGCSLVPGCVADCEDAEVSCRKECSADCTLCTAEAGCLDVPGCSAASDN
jgi:hypothetical protein